MFISTSPLNSRNNAYSFPNSAGRLKSNNKILAAYGKAYLEELNGYKVIHTFGSPYEEGYQHGKLLKNEIIKCFKEVYQEGFFKASPILPKIVWYFYAKLNEKFLRPEEKDELKGIADAAGLKYNDILVMNSEAPYQALANFLESLGMSSHCSQLAVMGKAALDGNTLIGRNLDSLDLNRWHKYALIQVHHPQKGYNFIAPGYAGKVLEAIIGWNEKNLIIAQNNTPYPFQSPFGLYTGILMRRLIQNCAVPKEAEEMIKNTKIISNAGTSILAANNKEAKVIEAAQNIIDTFKNNKIVQSRKTGEIDNLLDTLTLANHYKTPFTFKSAIPPLEGSLLREQRIKKLISSNYGKIDSEIIKNILTDKLDLKTGKNIGPENPGDNAVDWYGKRIAKFGPFSIPKNLEVRITTNISAVCDLKEKIFWIALGKNYISRSQDYKSFKIMELLK
ncbi:MAG: hypothetical protein HYU63_02925 [Armatimonadetes bacterium]|nr:hypothetical protein [Armatimonadota bacterium]